MTPGKDGASDDPHATRRIQLLQAVEVAHAIEEAAACRGTPHGTSDARRLEGHDHALVQCRRERRAFSDAPSMLSCFELLEGADERGNFEQSAPAVLQKTHSRGQDCNNSTLETTRGQMATPKSGRVQECHLIQVAF